MLDTSGLLGSPSWWRYLVGGALDFVGCWCWWAGGLLDPNTMVVLGVTIFSASETPLSLVVSLRGELLTYMVLVSIAIVATPPCHQSPFLTSTPMSHGLPPSSSCSPTSSRAHLLLHNSPILPSPSMHRWPTSLLPWPTCLHAGHSNALLVLDTATCCFVVGG